MIFGAMNHKSVAEMAEILFPMSETLVLTRPNSPRSLTASEILSRIPADLLIRSPLLTDSVGDALELAESSGDKGVVLITGSLYLVGEAQRLLNFSNSAF